MLEPQRSVAILCITWFGISTTGWGQTTPHISSLEAKLDEARQALRGIGRAQSVTTRHYQVLYLGNKRFAEDRARLLESTRGNFMRLIRRLGITIEANHERCVVIVLDKRQQMGTFYQRTQEEGPMPPGLLGYYAPNHNWAVFYNQRSDPATQDWERWLNRTARRLLRMPGRANAKINVINPRGKFTLTKRELAQEMETQWERVIATVREANAVVTQHEAAHQLAFNAGIQHRNVHYPAWLSEGLACMFEVPRSQHGGMGAQRTNQARLASYRALAKKNGQFGLAALLQFDPTGKSVNTEAFYAESWATFAFLFKRYPRNLGGYIRHLSHRRTTASPDAVDVEGTEPPDTPPPEDELATFQQFFSIGLDALQKQFDHYIRRLR